MRVKMRCGAGIHCGVRWFALGRAGQTVSPPPQKEALISARKISR